MMDVDVTVLAPAPYVTVSKAAEMTGLTVNAIRRKVQSGVWLEGKEYRKGPDGRIFVSVKGYASWVEQGLKSVRNQLESPSLSRANKSGEP